MPKDTKTNIVDSTLKLIDNKPFPQVRTKDIAEKSNISEATIFKYFKTKDSILNSLIDKFLNVIYELDLSGIENEEHFRNELITFFKKVIKIDYFKRILMKLILYIGMYKQDRFFTLVEHMNKKFFEPIENVVEMGKVNWGYKKNNNTKVHVRLFINSISLFSIQQDVFGAKKIEKYDMDEIIVTAVDNFLKSLR